MEGKTVDTKPIGIGVISGTTRKGKTYKSKYINIKQKTLAANALNKNRNPYRFQSFRIIVMIIGMLTSIEIIYMNDSIFHPNLNFFTYVI